MTFEQTKAVYSFGCGEGFRATEISKMPITLDYTSSLKPQSVHETSFLQLVETLSSTKILFGDMDHKIVEFSRTDIVRSMRLRWLHFFNLPMNLLRSFTMSSNYEDLLVPNPLSLQILFRSCSFQSYGENSKLHARTT